MPRSETVQKSFSWFTPPNVYWPVYLRDKSVLQSSVDVQHLAGCPGGGVTAQVSNGGGHIAQFPQPGNSYPGRQRINALLRHCGKHFAIQRSEFEKQLGIKAGQTSKDLLFSLDGLRCVGACGLAPVVVVNSKVYGQFKPEQVSDVLDYYKSLENTTI